MPTTQQGSNQLSHSNSHPSHVPCTGEPLRTCELFAVRDACCSRSLLFALAKTRPHRRARPAPSLWPLAPSGLPSRDRVPASPSVDASSPPAAAKTYKALQSPGWTRAFPSFPPSLTPRSSLISVTVGSLCSAPAILFLTPASPPVSSLPPSLCQNPLPRPYDGAPHRYCCCRTLECLPGSGSPYYALTDVSQVET